VLVSLIGLAALSRQNRSRAAPPEAKPQVRPLNSRPRSQIGSE
jgi:hypothetical protein